LKPLGALWLAGYRLGAISVKVKVGIAWSDLICTMLPKPPTRVKTKNGERSRKTKTDQRMDENIH